jgi:hypothetical protein
MTSKSTLKTHSWDFQHLCKGDQNMIGTIDFLFHGTKSSNLAAYFKNACEGIRM